MAESHSGFLRKGMITEALYHNSPSDWGRTMLNKKTHQMFCTLLQTTGLGRFSKCPSDLSLVKTKYLFLLTGSVFLLSKIDIEFVQEVNVDITGSGSDLSMWQIYSSATACWVLTVHWVWCVHLFRKIHDWMMIPIHDLLHFIYAFLHVLSLTFIKYFT